MYNLFFSTSRGAQAQPVQNWLWRDESATGQFLKQLVSAR
jgi:hypothetical protein